MAASRFLATSLLRRGFQYHSTTADGCSQPGNFHRDAPCGGPRTTHLPIILTILSKLSRGPTNLTMKYEIPVQFTGIVTVEVPDHLPPKDAKLITTKVALARILATTDNPDAPEDDVCSDFALVPILLCR